MRVLAAAHEHRSRLDEPIQIGLGGRVSTGKSTLVNALVGAKVAPTAARELTAFLTVYRYGPPRAVAHLGDGRQVPVPLTDEGPDVSGLLPAEVLYLSLSLQQAPLRRYTFIDTPGLGSAATSHGERTEAALLTGAIPELAPEVLLYVVREALREDDLDFVTRFSASADGSRSRLTTLAVLAHADSHGTGAWGADDPFQQARSAATRIAQAAPSVQACVAVSALLAESARTGALKEADAVAVRDLVGVPDGDLQWAAHLGPPAGMTAADFTRLSSLLTAYGLRYGRAHVESSVMLREWMVQVSGVAELESLLQGVVGMRTDCLRVEAMFTDLLDRAGREGWPRRLAGLLEEERLSGKFHALTEWEAWEELRWQHPNHELLADLEAELTGLEGMGIGPPRATGESDPLARAAAYQQLSVTASAATVAKAARVLSRSMMLRAGSS